MHFVSMSLFIHLLNHSGEIIFKFRHFCILIHVFKKEAMNKENMVNMYTMIEAEGKDVRSHQALSWWKPQA